MKILRSTAVAISLFIGMTAMAQQSAADYSSPANQYYWKNRPPFPGYWQQDVHYFIKAALDDKTDIITGEEELTYTNNSPDTLPFVYFHLYENAFQPGSYTDDLHQANKYYPKYGKYESEKKDEEVTKISIDGQDLKTELDNTIMKAWLPKPLLPNQSVKFNISFKSYFDDGGNIRRRMKMYKTFGYKHYDGVHWYPRIDVYDRKFGWETDQHLTREFYGDFGSYDVEITIPNNYILEGTGTMLNEKEVLPSDLRARLDISNFAHTAWNSAPSEMIHADGTMKTWKFSGINIHDFAFSADPLYRIGETDWNGIRIIAMCQEPHCTGWQNASSYTAKIIEFYSTHIGMYAYPKMVVCDAQDGMEYPMITLDGGSDPDYHTLLAHEVGHNWFFGMVGSNETYRALLDEGFTQFIDSWCVQSLDGPYIKHGQYKSGYVTRFKEEDKVINTEVYNRYEQSAALGDETVIDTHSDYFNGALRHGGGYGQVYGKTATMLWNLKYVLGDSLFEAAFSHYFNQWKFCHPYVEDFRNSMIQYTHVDLNWFFDEWLDTYKTIDYGVKSVHEGDSANVYKIKFRRYGRMSMPIDFTVQSNDGRLYNYYIPNTWYEKKTTATVLPRWIGWDKIRPTYTAVVNIPNGISDVMIDTTHRLADVNMLNNSMNTPVQFSFDSRIWNFPSWEHYTLRARPDFWYNGYDGLKAGLYMGGDYLGVIDQFDLTFHYNTGLGQSQLPNGAEINRFDYLSYAFSFRTPTNKFIRNSAFYFSERHLDGFDMSKIGFEVSDREQKNKISIDWKIMARKDSSDLNYLIFRNEWTPGKINSTLNINFSHPYTYHHGTGDIQLNLRSSTIGSDYDYHYLNICVINKNDLGPININTRTFFQIGSGQNWAKESMLFAAGANPEAMMDNKYTRSEGFFPTDWATFGSDVNHFQYGGGLDLRGYAGYLMPQYDWYGNVRNIYKGTSGYAFNAEMEFQELFKFIGRKMPRVNSVVNLSTYLFGDIGGMNFNQPTEQLAFGAFRADAGVGAAFTIKRFPPLQMVKPLTIRFDVPLFLNSTPYNSPEYIQMRWVVGINRAF
ncbi:MAG: M1 family metallopeptidase [Bacteroidetes bacterium]|nr:M1 family metallopeptidase [Bacteroidota bacterium]